MEANWGLVEDIHLVPYNNEGKKKLSWYVSINLKLETRSLLSKIYSNDEFLL
nr:hypothetical protein [Mycoplasmopsis bovis]